jgi:acyl-homoserine-lactone acylase
MQIATRSLWLAGQHPRAGSYAPSLPALLSVIVLMIANPCAVASAHAEAAALDTRPDAQFEEELQVYARDMLGDDFDLRAFHDVVPGDGAVPREQLDRRVRDWVSSQQDFQARIRRTSFGVAHIDAADYGSLGYGEGYAAAEDHSCNVAFSLLEARGEKARFLGAGSGESNIAFDAVLHAMDISGQARRAFDAQTPLIRSWLAGYTAGYNRYLREHRGRRNDSWCSGAPWLREASPVDFMARAVLLVQTLPRMADAIAGAQPPQPEASATAAHEPGRLVAALDAAQLQGMGSNAWAIGRDMTENGRGLLLANPHYPWYGSSRFWEKHLTIPGELDVYGAQLLGAPGVAIGFNKAIAWTHTVSASQRVVLYRLKLVEGDPTRYHYGNETRRIEARAIQVPVRDAEGRIQIEHRQMHFSHYGPMLILPGAAWGDTYAYTARDANEQNTALIEQWREMGAAGSMNAFIAAHERHNAMPWVNTMATSHDGRAVYLDNTNVGYLSADAEQQWRDSLAGDPLAAGLYQQRGMVLLNGSDPRFEWIRDSDAPIEGTTPFDKRPFLERGDYIFNANDSYWLSSPRQPLSGFSALYGTVETARSLRTRMNIRLLENRYGDAGSDGRFNMREVQQALFSNRGLGSELLKEDLLQACNEAMATDPALQPACEVLERYDGTLNLDSAGSVLFREWITRYEVDEMRRAGALFAKPFDAALPEASPAKLGDPALALSKLREAMVVLEEAGLPLDANLRSTQFAYRAGRAIAVHGGNRFDGVANLQMAGDPSASPIAGVRPTRVGDSRQLTDRGYPVVHGSSFIMTLAFENDGPVAEALLSYSQSGNPNSPHFTDQTELYARKAWRPVRFTPEAVAADTQSIRMLRSPAAQSP